MAEIFKTILSNILTAVYQPFWFAMLLAVLFMLVYKAYPSAKEAARRWVEWFKTDSSFRKIFLFAFYTALILFRTLLNRNMWANPLCDVLGKWWLYTKDGNLTTEAIENFLLFMPFAALLLWCFKDRLLGGAVTFLKTVWCSLKTVFLLSFTIEMLQLVLRLGTWQLSDLFYNTLGGAVGGIIYFIAYKIKHRKE
ncbi:MAG: VanZ family protein [Acutalibacteraceae bacterium]